jgi:hypothetical protein
VQSLSQGAVFDDGVLWEEKSNETLVIEKKDRYLAE